mmetsp:Transcript_3728/g.4943  ORF Transcript_3728/g.4943 Transcript_3728/m.4943 type:complete len:727 (+) Transcript_3728:86-2266(+)|eukprot:CAMPEP_0114335428 /NCGR_PEP_ID=MMETSP0101-20121206/5051_1 /TAXON_ID=38822 ORGANISM="Pteridomonas danica, Strain PT" /NCGR_SAMPLE_ID=MMETSP0101 /ASSEMBLY_ACC=CAM_ASM_000211 /LENGTH=726 /DNA_ID=CAMNT_0001467049 /DNA_START=34 /DNA_END=2214 /DNA_ORIENTATION=-
MKRNRGVSNASRALSSATAQGIISDEQKSWLRSVLAEGDPVVEEALDQAALGNSQPLKDLAHSGNIALRARLHTLSKDNDFQRLSFSRSQDTGANPTLFDLDMLAEDLRFSSLSAIENPEKLDDDDDDDNNDKKTSVDSGFDLEALLDEVTGMMTATTEVDVTTSQMSPVNEPRGNNSDLELDFAFGDQSSDNGVDNEGYQDGAGSMISSSSDGGGPRGNLSVRGSLMLAQMRARESSVGSRMMASANNDANMGNGDHGNGDEDLDANQLGDVNDGINISIIDDYFNDDSTTVSRGTDLDSIDQSMLAVLAQDDTFSPQQTMFKGNNKMSKNHVWTVEEPPPPPPPPTSAQPQPFYAPFIFGSCGVGTNNNVASSTSPHANWNNAPPNRNGMVMPPYGTPPANFGQPNNNGMYGQAGGGGSGGGQWPAPASWSPGMDHLHALQMQHRANVMQQRKPNDNHFIPSNSSDPLSTSNHSTGSNKRSSGQITNELCNRFDMIQNRFNLTSQQRELVFIIINRDDRFLTKQFDSAISDAENNNPQLLLALIEKAESMSSSLKEVGSLSISNHSASSNNSNNSKNAQNANTTLLLSSSASSSSSFSSSPVPSSSIFGTTPVSPAAPPSAAPALSREEEEQLEFQSTLASAQAACASLDKELLKEYHGILQALLLKRKASAVALRDAKKFDGALKVMKELKQVQALLDTCQSQLNLATAQSPPTTMETPQVVP